MSQPKDRQMEDGVIYDLNPPAVILGKRFHQVKCEYQVPNEPSEYVVEGIPEGGEKEESFVLRFSQIKGVKATRAKDQGQPGLRLRPVPK